MVTVAAAEEEGISNLCGARAILSDNSVEKSCSISQGAISCPQQQQLGWPSVSGPALCLETSIVEPMQHEAVQAVTEGARPAPKR